jgi:hypothetical protein
MVYQAFMGGFPQSGVTFKVDMAKKPNRGGYQIISGARFGQRLNCSVVSATGRHSSMSRFGSGLDRVSTIMAPKDLGITGNGAVV